MRHIWQKPQGLVIVEKENTALFSTRYRIRTGA